VDQEIYEGNKSKDLGKNNVFSPYSSIPFKVEVKLEIPMYDGQVNAEVLNNWLKQL